MQYVILFFFSMTSNAAVLEKHASGLMRTFEAENSEKVFLEERRSIEEFKKRNFSFLSEKHGWRQVSEISDLTHRHKTESLYYQGRRVAGYQLKTHYNRQGYLEYASSSLAHKVEGYTVPISREAQTYWKEKTREEFENTFNRKLNGGVSAEPVIFIEPEKGTIHSALEIHLVNDSPLYVRHFILDELTGKVLSEKQHWRNLDVSAKVFTVSPFSSAEATSVTLSVTSADKLLNSNLYVRREENTSSPSLVDITPGDYSSQINSDPAQYGSTCTGSTTDCPNQAFDGVNVFYHLSRFRTKIGTYLSDLGASVTFPSEPIPVMVNALTLKGVTTGSQTNNAQYVQSCRADGSMPRCMVFFRPARLDSTSSASACGSSSLVQLHDLAREALVVAHEYQHYVTDTITNIEFGCDSNSENCAVGDALHEAYSDYLGASYVTDVAGRDVTLVGEYGLQNCSLLQRELKNLRVYENSEADKDPHTSGLTFASGYWKLRTEYGMAAIDKLVIKSLFYMPTSPSFADSVESLVKADRALNDGIHVTRIRQLFYDELKVIGGQTGAYRDTARGIVEMGTKGCASTSYPANSKNGVASFIAFFIWLMATVALGRKGQK